MKGERHAGALALLLPAGGHRCAPKGHQAHGLVWGEPLAATWNFEMVLVGLHGVPARGYGHRSPASAEPNILAPLSQRPGFA